MCGICGLVNISKKSVETQTILSMMHSLRHRGPDDSGFYINQNMGLGHRRLSIIDLSEKGRQPLFNEDKSLAIVCNGEIYNYKELRSTLLSLGHSFYSNSDSEVILHSYEEYGEQAFAKFEGMFAFALSNNKTKTLYLVRDPFGINPLYYYHNNTQLIFASEIKSILASGMIIKELNFQSILDYLTFFYTPGPETVLKNIFHVKPGYFVKLDIDGILSEKKFWQITWDDSLYADMSESDLAEQVRDETSRVVKKSIIADVPVGILLSGGIDSSVLLYEMVQNIGSDFNAYTVSFSESGYDESMYAKHLAKNFNIKHHIVKYNPDEVPSLFDKMVYHQDSVSGNPCNIAEYFFYKLASEHSKVVIAGSGGDEIFAGYMTYKATKYSSYYSLLPHPMRKLLYYLSQVFPVSYKKYSFDYLLKKFTEGALYHKAKSHYWWRSIFTDKDKKDLLHKDIFNENRLNLDSFYKYDYYFIESKDHTHFQNQCLYADLYMFCVENAVMKVNNLSMAFSLEVRPSMLTHSYVERMINIPYKYKIKGGQTKYILRKAYEHCLPKQIVARKKEGIIAPVHGLIAGSLKTMIFDNFYSRKSLEIFNKKEISHLLNNHYLKRENNSFKIYNLLCFLRWYDIFFTDNNRRVAHLS